MDKLCVFIVSKQNIEIQFVSKQVFFFCCFLESPSFRLVMKVKCNVGVMAYLFLDRLTQDCKKIWFLQ